MITMTTLVYIIIALVFLVGCLLGYVVSSHVHQHMYLHQKLIRATPLPDLRAGDSQRSQLKGGGRDAF